MITSRFPLGDVSFSAEYFSTLVGEATKQCYGVAAMTPPRPDRRGQERGARQRLL